MGQFCLASWIYILCVGIRVCIENYPVSLLNRHLNMDLNELCGMRQPHVRVSGDMIDIFQDFVLA